MAEPADGLNVRLTHAEALVLYDWLSDLDERLESARRDEAQQTVLWRVEGQLESRLVEVVMPDYQEKVATAKRTITGE